VCVCFAVTWLEIIIKKTKQKKTEYTHTVLTKSGGFYLDLALKIKKNSISKLLNSNENLLI